MCNYNHIKLNFLSWNADGLRCKIDELLDLAVSDLLVDIIAICETRLSPQSKLVTPGFTCYRQDKHHSGRGQGVAILIRENLMHCQISIPKTRHMEAVAIKLSISGTDHIVISIYQSPNLPLLHSDLDMLLALGKHVLILGDFNANHEHWHLYSNTRGRSLFQHMLSNDYVIHASETPSQLNYRANLNPSNPDLILSKNVTDVSAIKAIPGLCSNHLPLHFTIGGKVQRKTIPQSYRYKDANWKGYRTEIDDKLHISSQTLNSPTEIENAVNHITNVIIESRNHNVPIESSVANPTKLPRRIKKLIKLKNRLRRIDQQLTDKEQKRNIRYQINNLQSKINMSLQKHNDESWDRKLAKVDNPSADIWRVVQSIKPKNHAIPPLKLTNGALTQSISEQCEVLADAFFNNMTLTIDWVNSESESDVQRSTARLNNHTNVGDSQLTYPKEVWKILCGLKVRKSPGSDGVHNLLLKNLSQKAIVYITKIFNGCLKLSYFPIKWKLAKIIPIKKPGKEETEATSYRPISLLPALGKVFEKIIQKRLMCHSQHLIINEQFGFRQGHSTIHQLARLVEHVAHNLNLKQSTGMFLLDVEKAFDTVWHDGLLHKLSDCIPLDLLKLVQSYLSNRSFEVHIDNCKSSPHPVPAGVPQGSILGPYLFLMYINDLPVQPRTHLACFADDTASFTSSNDYDLIVSRLQLSLDSLHAFFTKWKLKLNASKTEAIMFTRHRKPPSRTLKIAGHAIPWNSDVRYLGVTLDTKVNWTKHVSRLRTKGAQAMGALSPILNRHSKLSPKNKLRIYTSLIRPCLTYASPVWSSTCNTNYLSLQVLQNKALKIAFNTPWYTNLQKLHFKINLPLLKNFILKNAQKFYKNNVTHYNNLIKSIGQSRREHLPYIDKYGTYRLPHHYCLFTIDSATRSDTEGACAGRSERTFQQPDVLTSASASRSPAPVPMHSDPKERTVPT